MGLPNQAAGKQHRQISCTFFTDWAFVVGPPPQCLLILEEGKGLRLAYFMAFLDGLFDNIH